MIQTERSHNQQNVKRRVSSGKGLLGSLVHPDAPGFDEVKNTGLPCRGCDLAPSSLDAWLMVTVVLKIRMKMRARGRTCCLLIGIFEQLTSWYVLNTSEWRVAKVKNWSGYIDCGNTYICCTINLSCS